MIRVRGLVVRIPYVEIVAPVPAFVLMVTSTTVLLLQQVVVGVLENYSKH